MKTETLSILEKVKTGELTPKVAQKQLFVLFGVSGSDLSQRDFDITTCQYCGSTDIIGTHTRWWCSDCGKTHI